MPVEPVKLHWIVNSSKVSWTQGQDSSPDLQNLSKEQGKGFLTKRRSEKVHQTDSNPGPHDHQFNALTTRLPTAAAESTGNLCYLCTNLINVYCS